MWHAVDFIMSVRVDLLDYCQCNTVDITLSATVYDLSADEVFLIVYQVNSVNW